MNAKIVKKCSVTAIILVALYFLVVLINPSVTQSVQFAIYHSAFQYVVGGYLPQNLILSLMLLIPAKMMLGYAKREDNPALIRTAKLSLIAGEIFFLIAEASWLFDIGKDIYLKYLDIHPQSFDRYYEKLILISNFSRIMKLTFGIVACSVAVFLIVVFFMSMKNAVIKRMRFKGELVKPVAAVLIIASELLYWGYYVMNVLVVEGKPIEEKFHVMTTVNRIYAVTFTLIPLAALVFMLLMHCIIKIKPDDWDDVPPDEIVYVQAENIME